MKAILEGVVHVDSVSLDLPELQGTIEQISLDKCRRAAEAVSLFDLTSQKLLISDMFDAARSRARYWLKILASASMH